MPKTQLVNFNHVDQSLSKCFSDFAENCKDIFANFFIKNHNSVCEAPSSIYNIVIMDELDNFMDENAAEINSEFMNYVADLAYSAGPARWFDANLCNSNQACLEKFQTLDTKLYNCRDNIVGSSFGPANPSIALVGILPLAFITIKIVKQILSYNSPEDELELEPVKKFKV